MARQQPDGKWRADVTVKGVRKQKLCDSQKEAEDTENGFKEQILDGKPREKIRANSQITLKQAFENCLNNPEVAWLQDGEPTQHGKKQQYTANSFYKYWGANKPLREIKKEDWYTYIKPFNEGKWTNTNNRRACTMNKIFSQALADGHISPANLLKIKRKKEKLTMCRAYTRDEEVSILNECDKFGYLDLKDFVICLIDTGASPEDLRIGNSKNLIRNLDGSVTFNFKRLKTDIPVVVGTRKRTQDILIKRSNQKRFFMSSYRQLYNRWQDIREQLGKSEEHDWVFYTCRHTCASRMADAGYTLAVIADWLGHAPNSPVTRRYIHFFPKSKVNISKKMDEFEEKLKAEPVQIKHRSNF